MRASSITKLDINNFILNSLSLVHGDTVLHATSQIHEMSIEFEPYR